MTANRRQQPTDHGAPDPHGLLEDTPFNSIREAEAEAFGSTNPREHKRCPVAACGSTNLRYKPGGTAADCEHKRDGDYQCKDCGEHFDDPRQSARERALEIFEVGRQVDAEPLPDPKETEAVSLEVFE